MDAVRTLIPSLVDAEHDDDDGAARPRSPRDWVVDVLFVVIALGVGGSSSIDEVVSGGHPVWLSIVDLGIGTAVCLSLWWRRRFPVTIALVAGVVAALSNLAGAAALLALFTVAVHRPWPVVMRVTMVQLAGSAVFALVYPDDTLGSFFLALFIFLATAAVVGFGSFVRARRELVRSLRERAERAEADQAARVLQARDAERARIAREMHDVLAHRLSLLSMHAGALEFRPDATPEEVARAAGVIRASAHEALEDLRAVIGVLRSDAGTSAEVGVDGAAAVRPQPTLADVPALVEESRAAGMRIDATLRLTDDAAVADGVGRTVYRVVQEGLTNARKHAAGAAVAVEVRGGAEEGVTVVVVSRAPIAAPLPVGAGGGAADLPGAGTGLVGLAERAERAGGRLSAGPTDEGGFRLEVWLPWS